MTFRHLWSFAILLAGAFCLQLRATTTYTNGEDNSSPISASGSTTLTIASGTATQSGVLSGTGSFIKTGAGTLNFSASNTFTGTLTVTTGTLGLTGGTTTSFSTIILGNNTATATLDITGGTYAPNGSFEVGDDATGHGIVNQTGGSMTLHSGAELLIGQSGTGTYNLSGGTLTTASSATYGILIGTNANSNATFNLSGSGTLDASNAVLLVGRSNYAPAINTTDAYNQTGGEATVGTLLIGGDAGVNSDIQATLDLTGGTFAAANFTSLAAGNGDKATLTIGGTAQVTLPAFPTASGVGTTLSITFDSTPGGGGYLAPVASSATYLPGGTFTHAYLTANGANFNTNGYNITVGQVLEDKTTGGTLTKSGLGVLTLSGANTYTGATTVEAGTLLVTGSIASTAVTVGSGGTLGGSGTIGGPTTIQSGGTLAPGGSVLNFSSSLVMDSGSTSAFQINGPTQGTGYDSVTVAGLTTYGGTLALTFGSTIETGTTLALYGLTGGESGDYAAITATGSYSGSFVDTGGLWTLSIGGQRLSFNDSTGGLAFSSAVPEPATYAALLGAAALALVVCARRKGACRNA